MDELFELRVPHSAEAEQSVIGSMLIDPACIPDVLQKARSDDFYLQTNRDVFDTVSNMYIYGRAVDPVTTLDQMRVRGCLKDNSQSYLLELMQVTPTAANVMKYVDILREQSLLRALLKVGGEITTMVREGAGEADTMLEASEQKIYALRQGRTIGGLIKISNVIQDVYNQISEMAASGVSLPGISTGLPDLDSAILGLIGLPIVNWDTAIKHRLLTRRRFERQAVIARIQQERNVVIHAAMYHDAAFLSRR